MAIIRTHDIDDDGTGKTGTPRNAAWKEELYDQIDAALNGVARAPDMELAPGTYHNLALTDSPVTVIRTNGCNITGFDQAGGNIAGSRVIVINISGLNSGLFSEHTGSEVENRLRNFLPFPEMILGVQGVAVYVWCATLRWEMIHFHQGDWITVPFSAANFLGSGTTGWSVGAGNVTDQRYMINGRDIDILLTVENSTITGGVDGTSLFVGGWPCTFPGTHPYLPAISSVAIGGWGTLIMSPSVNKLSFVRMNFTPYPAQAGVYVAFGGKIRI